MSPRRAGIPPGSLSLALLAAAVNVAPCWRLARPVEGVEIALPALAPGLAAAACALFLAPGHAPAVASAAGVFGPLVGADLSHLDAVEEIASRAASIGGAGTFDAIVLSAVLTTLLA